MSDLIDRQYVTDALELGLENDYVDATKLLAYVKQLPSAEPEREWIPFDVALPNDRQKVLCINKHDEMMVGGYLTDYGMTFPCYFEKPIAWMPLPEPWRGD